MSEMKKVKMMSNETWSNDGMECPYCGHVNEPEEAMDYSEDPTTHYCDSCGSEFTATCFISYSWTGLKVGEDDE